MSFITNTPQKETNYSDLKNQASRRFVEHLKSLGRSFWTYTEETGETDIKPFEGWQ